MQLSFHAIEVSAEDDEDLFLVGFLKSADDPMEYVMFQRGKDVTEQDISLGLDGVYVEVDDQRYSTYGEIETCELQRGSIRILASDPVAARIRNIKDIDISFEIDDQAFDHLRRVLAHIFAGTGTDLILPPH